MKNKLINSTKILNRVRNNDWIERKNHLNTAVFGGSNIKTLKLTLTLTYYIKPLKLILPTTTLPKYQNY